MDTLPHRILEPSLRSNMTREPYTLHQVYVCYLDVMNRKEFDGFRKMSEGSLEKRLIEFSSEEGSWLTRKGRGEKAIYRKWEIKGCDLNHKQLIESVKRLLRWRW